jgi:actin-related protein
MELEEETLPEAILDVIEMCDLDVRPDLLNNIFLSGGSSMFPNLKSRIYQELEIELARRKKKNQIIKIIAPRERIFSVWVGGSILAMIPEFEQNWITRAKYFNEGIPDDLL